MIWSDRWPEVWVRKNDLSPWGAVVDWTGAECVVTCEVIEGAFDSASSMNKVSATTAGAKSIAVMLIARLVLIMARSPACFYDPCNSWKREKRTSGQRHSLQYTFPALLAGIKRKRIFACTPLRMNASRSSASFGFIAVVRPGIIAGINRRFCVFHLGCVLREDLTYTQESSVTMVSFHRFLGFQLQKEIGRPTCVLCHCWNYVRTLIQQFIGLGVNSRVPIGSDSHWSRKWILSQNRLSIAKQKLRFASLCVVSIKDTKR